jgi:hypothetical protein
VDDDQPAQTYSRVTTTERGAGADAGRRAPAGWYPDPAGIHSQRYWDGGQWTTQVVDRNGLSVDHQVRRADQVPAHEAATVDLTVPEPEPEPEPEQEPEPEPELTGGDASPARDSSAAAFATRVLERACDIAGVDCRNNAMTADDAIAALPADLAEATVRVMHRTYADAGDTHNAAWAETKLDEIRARPPEDDDAKSHGALEAQSPEAHPPEEAAPEARSETSPEALPVASITPIFGSRTASQPSILAGWYRDPGGRHQYRYWSGDAWTDRVANDSVQSEDPLRWDPPSAASSLSEQARAIVARRGAPASDAPAEEQRTEEPQSALHGLLARIRAMRTFWVLSIVVFSVLTVGFLLLPVNESATTIDGAHTVTLHCGSVISPEATATRGADLTNASSICRAARHSNTSRVYLFGALALVSVALASFSRVRDEDDDAAAEDARAPEPATPHSA